MISENRKADAKAKDQNTQILIIMDIRQRVKRHLQMVSLEEFKKLMLLEVADAKAHIIHPIIQARIDICGKWSTSYADEMLEQIENSQNE